jgi:RNA polymerase sigma factor (sigma-70 family)
MRSTDRIYSELLVCRCQEGEREAFDELVQIWQMRLFYYVRRLIRDEDQAWQILQEIWIKVFRSLKRLKDTSRFPGWLYRIARHQAIDNIREEYRQSLRQVQLQQEYTSVDHERLTFDDADQVHFGLDQISVHFREVLTLFFLQDLSLGEISTLLNIPVGTVKSRLYFAKKALKAVIEKEANQYES